MISCRLPAPLHNPAYSFKPDKQVQQKGVQGLPHQQDPRMILARWKRKDCLYSHSVPSSRRRLRGRWSCKVSASTEAVCVGRQQGRGWLGEGGADWEARLQVHRLHQTKILRLSSFQVAIFSNWPGLVRENVRSLSPILLLLNRMRPNTTLAALCQCQARFWKWVTPSSYNHS